MKALFKDWDSTDTVTVIYMLFLLLLGGLCVVAGTLIGKDTSTECGCSCCEETK